MHLIHNGVLAQWACKQDPFTYELRATLLHLNPTILYDSDVSGVTYRSLLQRIRLLNGLCAASHADKPVTLTAQGKRLFASLHSQVRCNLQTTMLRVNGWTEEPAALASRTPILPSLTKTREQKTKK